MKNLWIYILFNCLVSSCDSTYYYEFIILNDTPYNIRIEGFECNNVPDKSATGHLLELVEIIEIKPKSKYSVKIPKGYQAEPDNIFNQYEICQANIVFNNEKIITQNCEGNYLRDCEIERNILGFETQYEKEKIGKSQVHNEYRFTYTITEEDYNNAVPIEN